MAKQQSGLSGPGIKQLSLLANDWHRCERFERRGFQCPYRIAGIEEEEPEDKEKSRQLPIAIPARRRLSKPQDKDISDADRVLDIRKVIQTEPSPGQVPDPAQIPAPVPFFPRPNREPIPGKPVDTPEPIAALERLPDGMPVIDLSKIPSPIVQGIRQRIPNPNAWGDLIKWMANAYSTGLATKPAISMPTPFRPFKSSSNTPRRAPETTSLQNFAAKAASAEEIFAKDFASSTIPVRDTATSTGTSTSRKRPSNAQIAMAAAAGATGATAATMGMRRGGGKSGGGLQFKSVFEPNTPQLTR